MKNILYILIFILALPATAQIIEAETDPCLVNLNSAQTAYDGGNIELIPSFLKECLNKNGYSKENKTKAYKLLINSYIFQGIEDSADIYMVKFLKFNPEYRPSEQIDRREFIDLHDAYRNYPLFAAGGKLGLGLSQLQIINEFGAHNIESASLDTKYRMEVGFSGEIFGAFHPHRDGEIFVDLGYITYKFSEVTTLLNYSYPNGTDNYTQYDYSETVNSLNISVGYKYLFRKNIYAKIIPYVSLGYRGGLMLKSKIDIVRTLNEGEATGTIKGSDLDAKHLRNSWNSWVTANFGLKFKIAKGNIFFELGYDYNLYNISNPNERFNLKKEETNELLFKYFYVSNDFRLNNIYFKVGYNYNFYIPKKTGVYKASKKEARAEKKKVKKTKAKTDE